MRRIGMVLVFGMAVASVAACGDDAVDLAAHDRGDGTVYEGSFTVVEGPKSGGPQLCGPVGPSLYGDEGCGGLPITNWDWADVEGVRTYGKVREGGWHVEGTFNGESFTLTATPSASRQDEWRDLDFGDERPSPACDEPEVVDASHGDQAWHEMAEAPGGFAPPSLVSVWVTDPAGEWDGPWVGNVVVKPGAREGAIEHIRQRYLGALCVVEKDMPLESELHAIQLEVFSDPSNEVIVSVGFGGADSYRGVVDTVVWVLDKTSLEYVERRWDDLVVLHPLLLPVE